MNASESKISDSLLEQYLLRELPPNQMQKLQAQIATDLDLQNRLHALSQSNLEILTHYPPQWILHSVQNRQRQKSAPQSNPSPWFKLPRLQYALPALASLLVLLFLNLEPQHPRATEESPSTIRLKGAEAGLIIYRKINSGTELLPPKSSVQEGDTLQVFYHNKNEVYGMVFSVDGSGSTTLHFPEFGGVAPFLKIGAQVPLPHAFKLDQAPTLERFFLVTSLKPFFCDTLLALYQKKAWPGQALPDSIAGLEPGFQQYPYTLIKPNQPAPSPKKSVKK